MCARTRAQLRENTDQQQLIFLWLPEKGSHIAFTWPFLHFLTLRAAVAAKLLFQFKSDLELKCVSHLGLHLGRPNFTRQPPSFWIKNILFPKNSFLWLPEKVGHFVFTWPFLHFFTLPAAVAAKLLFQFKSDLEFKCVSHLGLHLGRPNFTRQPPTF